MKYVVLGFFDEAAFAQIPQASGMDRESADRWAWRKEASRWLHHVLIHFLQSGYAGPAEASRAKAGGAAMPLPLSR